MPSVRLRASICVVLAGCGLSASAQAPTEPPLTFDEKMELLSKAQQAGVPRGGRRAWLYRPWGCPRSDEAIVWDSAAQQDPRVDRVEFPCWLRQTISLCVEGLVDGNGQPYSGPLFVTADSPLRIIGPYPEGFACCLDGAFRVDLLAKDAQFAENLTAHVGVHYRVPCPELLLADGPWPPNPDLSLDFPPREVTIEGQTVSFRTVALEAGANTFSDVTGLLAGDVRDLRVEARLVLPSRRPASRLPMEFHWHFQDAPMGFPQQNAVHSMDTSLQGAAQDSIQVPATIRKGWVEIKCHTNGDQFSTLTIRQFDFTKPGQ